MLIKNFLETEGIYEKSHGGQGKVRTAVIFGRNDFETNISFILFTEIPPGSSIGYHPHGQDEEIFVILEGNGILTTGSEEIHVSVGDIIINQVGQSHGLVNRSSSSIKLLVFQVMKPLG